MSKDRVFYTNLSISDLDIVIASTINGLAFLDFSIEAEEVNNKLKKQFPNKPLVYDDEANKAVVEQLVEYFNGGRDSFSLPLDLIGTSFQKKVWTALMDIPYGTTVSYKYIAEKVGNPKGMRAIGMANNRNKIPIIIPCHRVIGANEQLIGYGGGLHLKKKLLMLEGINVIGDRVVT